NERHINSMVLALVNLRAQNVALREELALPEPMLQMQVDTWAGSELQASLYNLEGRYWLLIDRYTAAEADSELQVNADSRWAYQVGVADMENLTRRRQDLLRSGESDLHPCPDGRPVMVRPPGVRWQMHIAPSCSRTHFG